MLFNSALWQVLALALGLTAGLTLLIPIAAKTGGADGAPIFLIIIRCVSKDDIHTVYIDVSYRRQVRKQGQHSYTSIFLIVIIRVECGIFF